MLAHPAAGVFVNHAARPQAAWNFDRSITMDFRLSPEHEAFRREVDAFVDALVPPGTEDPRELPDFERTVRIELAKRHWLALPWPKEYGGLGASPIQQMVFNEVMAYRRASVTNMGVAWVGPAIMLAGTDEQKAQYLPRITSGEDVWCTLYSEPAAGSDLAGLQTRAVREGDDYVVNGQKIWTSGAHRSNWGWLAARTDSEAPKHKGISMFCLRMDTPGVSVRPLVNMAGTHEFNEVFFDNVRIPASQRVGEENRGWYTLAVALDFERSSIGATSTARRALDDLAGLARTGKAKLTESTRARVADCAIAVQVLRLMGYRIAAEQEKTGIAPTLPAQMAKLFAAELNQRITLVTMQVLGMAGQAQKAGTELERFRYSFLRSIANTVEGGTSEIQRNVIATRGLGLPRA
jgi:alkylation response protein AidB-like acyl-CoA dehydrogenase